MKTLSGNLDKHIFANSKIIPNKKKSHINNRDRFSEQLIVQYLI